MKEPTTDNSYDQVIAHVFRRRWTEGATEVFFSKDDLIDAAHELKLRIKNVADILYTFRSRRGLPAGIAALGQWVISSHGSGRYAFTALSGQTLVEVPISLKCYPIPYAVPEIVAANLAEDEQGLLTIVRYNRILDVFTGLACFHLQSHVRTQVKGHGQVEIDDLYVGIDKDGRGFVLPVEAKDAGESLGVDKAVALTLFAQAKYPELICRPIAIIREGPEQFACVEFEPATSLAKVAVLEMRRYRLVRETDS
jgi:hypothetical protein